MRDVGVIKRGEHTRLTLKSGESFEVASDGGRQHLDRDVAIQLRVSRPVHFAHPTRAQRG
jgi:hypothetical protein